jgi:hypothetical protein
MLRYVTIKKYRVFQKWRIPNSERGREGPNGACKFALPEEDII